MLIFHVNSDWSVPPFSLRWMNILWRCTVLNHSQKLHLRLSGELSFVFCIGTTTGSAPLHLNKLLQTYASSRSLYSASEWRIVMPSQRGSKSLSQTSILIVPCWWNDLTNTESLDLFKKRLKIKSGPYFWTFWIFCSHPPNQLPFMRNGS